MRFLLVTILVAVGCRSDHGSNQQQAADLPSATPWDSLVGMVFPPEPIGYADTGGMVLDSQDKGEWGMGQLVRDGIRYLILDSLHHYEGGKAHWKIIAATMVPRLESGEEFVWVDCALDKAYDPTISALGVWRDTTLTRIRYAVRPNVTERRFELLPAGRVSCDVERDRT